jgi:hypothetical protein
VSSSSRARYVQAPPFAAAIRSLSDLALDRLSEVLGRFNVAFLDRMHVERERDRRLCPSRVCTLLIFCQASRSCASAVCRQPWPLAPGVISVGGCRVLVE